MNTLAKRIEFIIWHYISIIGMISSRRRRQLEKLHLSCGLD